MESEKKIVEMMDERSPMAKYWMPLVWATNIINRARKESLISSDHVVQTLLMELSEHRRRLGSIISYDTVCIPLVYTQVVTLSVYIYFMAALIGRQFITPPVGGNLLENIDIYFPFVTVLQFCFYIGWLKVAEVLIGPFGEDDDDIELNWLIDRHIKAAYMIVDEMHEEHPELLKDQYWDEVVPRDLPYTVASEHYRRYEPKGSAEFFTVKQSEALYANLQHRKSVAHDDVYADYESVDTPMVERRKNWFQRQVQRMSSIRRSSSTTYSSGLFGGNRSRHNSVYATPNDGGVLPMSGQYPPAPPHPPQKMSIYDRLIRRKSTRRGPGKLNVNIPPSVQRSRPRIPTPDVSKEIADKDNKLIFQNNNNNHVGNGVVNNAQPPSSTIVLTDASIMQVLLPIAEADGNQSTITSTGSTAALAQAVLSPTLKSAGLQAVITQPVSVAAVTSAPPTVTLTGPIIPTIITGTSGSSSVSSGVKITEIQEDSGCGSSSGSPSSGGDDRSRKTSTTSQRRGEVYV